jgi:hypothetical protein
MLAYRILKLEKKKVTRANEGIRNHNAVVKTAAEPQNTNAGSTNV